MGTARDAGPLINVDEEEYFLSVKKGLIKFGFGNIILS
jgi:hypothetical protein